MQFNVPQFIEIEDRIFGPLTLKQFLIMVGVGVIIFLIWYAFKLWFTIVIGVPLILIVAAFIFIKIDGRPLTKVFSAWLNFQTNPRFYVWRKK